MAPIRDVPYSFAAASTSGPALIAKVLYTLVLGLCVILAVQWWLKRMARTIHPGGPPRQVQTRATARTGAETETKSETSRVQQELKTFEIAAHSNPSAPVVWSPAAIEAAAAAGCPASKFAAAKEMGAAATDHTTKNSQPQTDDTKTTPAIPAVSASVDLTEAELRAFDGSTDRLPANATPTSVRRRYRYVSVGLQVFDVTDAVGPSSTGKTDGSGGMQPQAVAPSHPFDGLSGYDISRYLVYGQVRERSILREAINETFHAIQKLERFRRYFESRFPLVGRLITPPPVNPIAVAPPPPPTASAVAASSTSPPPPVSAADAAARGRELHAAIDRNDRTALTVLLTTGTGSVPSHLFINALDERTQLTPLHHAIEAAPSEDGKTDTGLIEELLRFSPDLNAKASLYDDETPLAMAQRFQLPSELLERLQPSTPATAAAAAKK